MEHLIQVPAHMSGHSDPAIKSITWTNKAHQSPLSFDVRPNIVCWLYQKLLAKHSFVSPFYILYSNLSIALSFHFSTDSIIIFGLLGFSDSFCHTTPISINSHIMIFSNPISSVLDYSLRFLIFNLLLLPLKYFLFNFPYCLILPRMFFLVVRFSRLCSTCPVIMENQTKL